jgi:hypothetical protein
MSRTQAGYVDYDDAFDERGVLRDQKSVRVRMQFMDSTQRSVRRGSADAVATFDANRHRPGWRSATNTKTADHNNDARQKAYDAYHDFIENQWRGDATGAQARGAQEGDSCVVRSGGVDEGNPGHLRMVNGELQCVPDAAMPAMRSNRIRRSWMPSTPSMKEICETPIDRTAGRS